MATRAPIKAGISFVALALATAVAAQPAAAQAAPGADLYVPPGIGVHTWVGQQTHPVAANVVNMGDLTAEDVAVTLSVSAGWTVAVPTDDPSDRSCEVAVDQRSVTCTFDEVAPGGGVGTYSAPVTSPAGASAPAAVTVSASSPTPDLGTWPNQTSDTLPHEGGSITVTPSTGLLHGQTVQIDLVGRTPNTGYYIAECGTTEPTNLGDCDLATAAAMNTDSNGDATLTPTLIRFINTANGIIDCAVSACSIGVATAASITPCGAAPLTFTNVPPPSDGIAIALSSPGYLEADPEGPATVKAELSCTTDSVVEVEFKFHQFVTEAHPTQRENDIITIPCTAGSPIAITSDLLGTRVLPGTATVLIHATSDQGEGWAYGQVDIDSNADAVAAFLARLEDPDDTTAVDDFIATLIFRVTYNPEFAHDFWRAVLQGTAG